MYDVVCIGNAIIDVFLTIHQASEHCHVSSETQELRIKLGDKIPLENAQFELGGNANNVSVGLTRLGLHTGLMVELGNDEFSHKIKKQLEKGKVSLAHTIISESPSSFAIGIQFKGERILFVQHVERHHNFSYDTLHTKWVYLSSLGEQWRHVYKEVPAFIKSSGARLAFNPGTRQIEAGKEALEESLAITDILFLNKEEAERLAKKPRVEFHDKKQMRILMEYLQEFGPKTVVITDGKNGSYALENSGVLHYSSIVHSPVVEKTGAGDAFASGFLGAYIHGKPVKEAMLWGTVNAASVIGQIGAQPGLLLKEQIEKKVYSLQ